jgi:hypothetical protein
MGSLLQEYSNIIMQGNKQKENFENQKSEKIKEVEKLVTSTLKTKKIEIRLHLNGIEVLLHTPQDRPISVNIENILTLKDILKVKEVKITRAPSKYINTPPTAIQFLM